MEILKKDLKNLDFMDNNDTAGLQLPSESHAGTYSEPTRKLKSDLFASYQAPASAMESKLSQKVLLQMEERIVGLQKQVDEMNKGFRQVVHQVNEFIRAYQTRFEKMGAAVTTLNSNFQARTSETQQGFSQLSGQMKERKVMDLKLEEMMNRHNAVLRNYEGRLQQMQRMLSEKEAQFLSAQSALNDAKMEISRLKRV